MAKRASRSNPSRPERAPRAERWAASAPLTPVQQYRDEATRALGITERKEIAVAIGESPQAVSKVYRDVHRSIGRVEKKIIEYLQSHPGYTPDVQRKYPITYDTFGWPQAIATRATDTAR